MKNFIIQKYIFFTNVGSVQKQFYTYVVKAIRNIFGIQNIIEKFQEGQATTLLESF